MKIHHTNVTRGDILVENFNEAALGLRQAIVRALEIFAEELAPAEQEVLRKAGFERGVILECRTRGNSCLLGIFEGPNSIDLRLMQPWELEPFKLRDKPSEEHVVFERRAGEEQYSVTCKVGPVFGGTGGRMMGPSEPRWRDEYVGTNWSSDPAAVNTAQALLLSLTLDLTKMIDEKLARNAENGIS